MPFMQPETSHATFVHVETTDGETFVIPAWLVPNAATLDDLAPYTDGTPDTWEIRYGWYVHFSAPGFMDATDWQGPYETEAAALTALAETFDVCSTCWEQCWGGDNPCNPCDDTCDQCHNATWVVGPPASPSRLCQGCFDAAQTLGAV